MRVYAPHDGAADMARYRIHPKRIDFARKLIGELHGANAEEFFQSHVDAGTFDSNDAISVLIDTLIAQSRDARHMGRREIVMPEPGYYAVEYNGTLRFYAVKEGKGKWAGRTFINRFRSDQQDRVYSAEQNAVCETVLADPAAAQKRFATELTRCYVCGRMLTDEVSRELGIGPDCRGRRA